MKTFAILPIESEALKFDSFTFQAENLDDVLIVHVPDDSSPDEVEEFRDKLLVAITGKTIIVVPAAVQFCRIKEVGA